MPSQFRLVRSKIGRLWEQGYLYAGISLALALAFAVSPAVGILDWRKEIAYFEFIRTSIGTFRSLPWFWWNRPIFLAAYPAADYSSSFIANPETMLFSPFTPLLLTLEALPYIKLLVVVHCLIGIAGCFALRARLHWGSHQLRVYLILFLLSPFIIQHLAVGYTPWLNLYFFPWLIFFMADDAVIRRILGIAGVLGLVLLQGGSHVALWFALLLVMCAILKTILDRTPSHLIELVAVAIVTALLSFVRLYATVPVYGEFRQFFAAGYEPLSFLFWSLFPPLLVPPLAGLLTSTVWMGVPAWDAGLFWGASIVLTAVLVMNFSRYQGQGRTSKRGPISSSLLTSVFIASLALLVLSFDSLFAGLIRILAAVVPVGPLEAAEKYPFRLALPAFLGLSVVIAQHSEHIWDTLRKLGSKAVASAPLAARGVGLLLLLVFGLLVFGLILGWNGATPDGGSLLSVRPAPFLVSEVPILAGLAIALLVLWFAHAVMNGSDHHLEAVLAIPFVLASILWLSVAVSVPSDKYHSETATSPNVRVAPIGSRVRVSADPHQLILLPVEGAVPSEYVLPRTDPRDMAWLRVASDNALMTTVDGRVKVIPVAPGPIVLAFNTRGYKAAGLVTLTSWILLVVLMFAQKKISRRLGSPAEDSANPSG